jgi:hypothetical protein
MSGKGKNRAVSPTLNIVLIVIIVTAIAVIKATISKVFKLKPFAGSRFKFKVFYT